MSNDLLLLSLEQNAQALAQLRLHPPLFAAMVCLEDEGTDPLHSLQVALPEYVRATSGQVRVVHTIPFSTGAGGHTYAQTVFANGAVPKAQRNAAHQAFLPLAHRMSGLIREVPDRTRERLGFREVFATPMHDWVWVLVHLAWHFPEHFARGVVHRDRLLQTEHGEFVAPEDMIQLCGVAGHARDRYPGLIFSRFPFELDLVSATGHAIELLRQAVRGGNAFEVTDAIRDQVRRLHQEFIAIGQLATRHTPHDLEVRVLRLDNSFRTPSASQWAGYQTGGALQEELFLARLGKVKEVCVLRGPSVNDFTTRANRAGALLPAWPDQPGAALLEDAHAWLGRVARRRELQSEQFYFLTEDGRPPHGEPLPRSQVAQHVWDSTRMSPGWGRVVTDHRGNVERWVGFVLYMLKEFEPDSVEIQTCPVGEHGDGHGWNAMLTLRGMDLYQASARAMELAGWVWRGSPNDDRSRSPSHPPTGQSEGATVSFDDPWATDAYPPPAAGRYIRFHKGDRSETGELEWRPGWAWAERPEDGWVECGECGSSVGRVLIARGRPPAVCDWLPPEWPAGYYPLGVTAEHCAGWRELVLSVLIHGQDTIPPDDREYGWLTLTRATRHLAHHLGVIPLDRVLAPLPSSRTDARREVEPLLDGLVFARRGGATPEPQTAPQSGQADIARAGGSATAADLTSELEHLLAEARRGYADANDAFTIVAVPCRPSAGGARIQRCEDESPDAGQIRDGVFYWPFGSIRNLESVTIDEHERYMLTAFDEARDPAVPFSEFSRRAAAALLAARPLWLGMNRPAAGATTWVAATMFLAPSAREHTVELPSGVRVLRHPWAACIAALRDILHPPAASGSAPADPAPPPGGGPVLDKAELSVLTLLRDRHPVLVMNVDIEAAVRLSKQKVGKIVTDLIGMNLATRPNGKRNGVMATVEGIALVDRIRKSSPDHP